MVQKIFFCSVLLFQFVLSACDQNHAANTVTNIDTTSGKSIVYAIERQACVDKINVFRATENLPALIKWDSLEICIDTEAKKDSETGKAHSAFGSCKEWAQDECPGWGSVNQINTGCLQAMWNEGAGPAGCANDPTCYQAHGHYLNMSNKSYTKVACGFYETPAGKVWGIQNFR